MRIRSEYLPFGRPAFGDAEIAAVARVMRSGWVGMGAETIAFEDELASHVGIPHVVTVNSCTSALFLALRVLGVGRGDEVICPSLTWCATANAAMYLGARPVLCDVDRDSLSVSPETVLPLVTPRTRAVMVVHFGGYAVDVAALQRALPERIRVVEDAAHALGSRYPDGRPVGASGNLVCFSFYANKNLSTGEGGAIASADGQLADELRSLRQNAMPADAWQRYTHARTASAGTLTGLGYKMNYTDLQACIGRVQLRRQAEFAATRLAIARRYLDALASVAPDVQFQTRCGEPDHARHLLVVRLPIERVRLSRDQFLLGLRARNIGASVHSMPLHLMPLYDGCSPAALPATDWLHERILTLPISASMTVLDADEVVEHVADLLA